jgi:protein-disulfide isomerase
MASKGSTASGAATARKAAAELRAKQRAAARRQAGLYGVVALLLLGGFVAAILVILKNSNDASAEYEVYRATNAATSSNADASGGFLIGQDDLLGGNVPADTVRVDVYEDPMCPICHQFDQMTTDEISYLRENGEIAFYYHPIAILDRYSSGTRYSTRSVSALVTVSEYDPAHFMAFVEGLFTNQPAENSKGLTNAEIADVARSVGVSEAAIAKISEGEFTQWVESATNQSSIDGVGGTPTLRIAGVDYYGWTTQGNISGAVAYVKEYGADAFRAALEAAAAAAAEPTPSGSS